MSTTSSHIRPHQHTLIVHAAALLLLPTALFAQGALTPPGAPAPTMKTLDEVEPCINIQRTINPFRTTRTIISSSARPVPIISRPTSM